ncbi:M48 family metallopeptidase [Natronomonas sp. CBA1123]|uniref:M48 family metallopeptidase n=1 Tax=Natronomonas sp. CBA1123 TaxID=2668070 RepID=UPI0018D205C5|nr:M48 family metalloprotease [Natronomonas sp. CBA1123]
MKLRLRLSLLARMAVALGILLSISLVLAVILSIFGGMLGFAIFGWVYEGVDALADLPRLSTALPVPAWAVASAAIAAIVGVVRGWPYVRNHTETEYVIPPTTPISLTVTAGLLGCLYLTLVEGSAALRAALSTAVGLAVVFGLGVVLALWVTVADVRARIRELRETLAEDSHPIEESHPDVATTVSRLAQLADVPEPAVHITETARPESVTIGYGDDAIIVVSTGLLETLTGDELEAVLAHEISHLANGDSRVMGAALGPVLAADEWMEDDPHDFGDRIWNGVFFLLKLYGQLGTAILSRGREWSADAGAAELTGDPAALASALRRLGDARTRPETDLREWEHSVAVMDILPPAASDITTGPFRTHPATEDRIEHLRNRTESLETAD